MRSIYKAGLTIAMLTASCSGAKPASTTPETATEQERTTSEDPEPQTLEESAEPASTDSRRSGEIPRTPAQGSSMEEFMQVHAKDAELIRSAVIRGQPEEAGKPADSLMHLLDDETLPQSWGTSLKQMLIATQKVKDSPDIATTAAAVADLGVACGACHQRQGGPSPELGQPPADDGSIAARMNRHVWATERLWDGLYVPSSPAWTAGAEVLLAAPFPREVLKKGGVYAKSAATGFENVAAKAPKQRTSTDRARLYAELLSTCATCHMAMKQ